MKTGTVIVANISRIAPRSIDDLHAFNGVTMQRTSDSNPLQWRAGFPVSRALIQYDCRSV
jgi:hypothetical protein